MSGNGSRVGECCRHPSFRPIVVVNHTSDPSRDLSRADSRQTEEEDKHKSGKKTNQKHVYAF